MTITDCEYEIRRVHVLLNEANARKDGEAVAEYSDHLAALERIKTAHQNISKQLPNDIANGGRNVFERLAVIGKRFKKLEKVIADAEFGFRVPRRLRWL